MDVHPFIRHEPDPDHPGWMTWDVVEDDRFNVTIGKLLVRADGPGRATCRMFPDRRHSNLGDMVHGGAILTFVDMAFFAGGRLAGADVMRAVTLDCSVRFLSAGRLGVPLDAEVELLRETKRLAFFAGKVKQGDGIVAAFSGALRKATHAPRSAERTRRGATDPDPA
ncbi:PaaI family thioesterase [Sphingosinicella sp. CPCC 101087]|uniref:PaaI family thioesterase n=1 Tax=Sphingosinicella sp. CPCC 101087 TaxID=2497754 RepID=UPI00101BEC1E|nr:PaaI family thioesterase [Sphingosinicella sp. CPCC 101087]